MQTYHSGVQNAKMLMYFYHPNHFLLFFFFQIVNGDKFAFVEFYAPCE